MQTKKHELIKRVNVEKRLSIFTYKKPLKASPTECPKVQCRSNLIDTVKTGFKYGLNMQWKAYCSTHGYLYYDINKG